MPSNDPYHIHRMIQDLLGDEAAAKVFAHDPQWVFDRYGVTADEVAALDARTIESMGALGIHPNLQMKYLRLCKVPSAGAVPPPGPLDAYLDRLKEF